MTVLDFHMQEDAIYLITDTMVSEAQSMEPILFTTKVFPVPHWEGLICGTGIMQFINSWFHMAVSNILATNVALLDEFTPVQLRELWARGYVENEGDYSSTVYHLGFDRAENRFVGFAYRSTDDFVSERIEYGTRIKPDLDSIDNFEPANFPEGFIEIAESQKLQDDSKPVSERVGVGGSVIAYRLWRQELQDGQITVNTLIWKCHEFSDAAEAYQMARANLPA
jgi:hypothetical protein